MKAGQDVNIEAGKNINIRAKENIKIEAGGEVDFLAKKDLRITSSEKFSAKAEKEFAITAGDTIGITSDSDIFEQGSNIFMNTAPGPEADEATEIDSASSVTGPSTQTVAGFWQEGEPYEDKINIIPRVPQHEPWKDH